MELATLEEAPGADGAWVVRIRGRLDRDGVPEVQARLMRLAGQRDGPDLVFDLTGVTRLDTAGVAFFSVLEQICRSRQRGIRISALSDRARQAFQLLPIIDAEPPPPAAGKGLFARLGGAAYDLRDATLQFLQLAADAFVWSVAGATRTRRVRKGAVWTEGVRIGLDALPIVALIALLIGLVLALQSAYQLRQFGGNIYMANLIAVSMTREMGPLITAIIIAGRSGAAIAAEVATMSVSEEIAALRVMGLSPTRYLVVPKLQAITLSMPALTTFANLIGITGGFVVALLYLELSGGIYFRQVWSALQAQDIIVGLAKSVVFAWIIVLVGAHKGFQAHGGAESVGLVTTQSVVSSIFWVIVADAAFSLQYLM